MIWLRHIVAVVLLALWMPATQHCDLAAAGLLAAFPSQTHDGESDVGHADCTSDNCKVVEGGYHANNVLLAVVAPTLHRDVCLLVVWVQRVLSERNPAVFATASFAEPCGWVPVWHFDRRLASQPRAPSVLV